MTELNRTEHASRLQGRALSEFVHSSSLLENFSIQKLFATPHPCQTNLLNLESSD